MTHLNDTKNVTKTTMSQIRKRTRSQRTRPVQVDVLTCAAQSKPRFQRNFFLKLSSDIFMCIFIHSLEFTKNCDFFCEIVIFKKLKVQKSQRGEMTFRIVNEPNGLKMTSSFTTNSAQNITKVNYSRINCFNKGTNKMFEISKKWINENYYFKNCLKSSNQQILKASRKNRVKDTVSHTV